MSTSYLVRLDESLENGCWMHFLEHQPAGDLQQGKLHELLAEAQEQQLVILLPATQVSLMYTEIAARQEKQIEAAIPFALEDEIATDIDELFFAYRRQSEGNGICVATVKLELIEHLYQVLDSYSFKSIHVVAENQLLPFEAPAWTLLVEDERWSIRYKECAGFGAENDNLVDLIEALNIERQNAEAETASEPQLQHLNLYDFRCIPYDFAFDLSTFAVQRVNREDDLASLMLTLYQNWLNQPRPCNLLQGRFRVRQKIHANVKLWSAAAGLAVLSLLLYMTTLSMDNSKLDRERQSLDEAIYLLYQQLYPNESLPQHPRVNLEKRLETLKNTRPDLGVDLRELLALSGKHLNALPKQSVAALRYRSGTMEIDLIVDSVKGIEELQRKLVQENLDVELRSVTHEGGETRGRLVVYGAKL